MAICVIVQTDTGSSPHHRRVGRGVGKCPLSFQSQPIHRSTQQKGAGGVPPSVPVSAGSSQHPAEGGGGRASFSPLVPAGGGRDDTS